MRTIVAHLLYKGSVSDRPGRKGLGLARSLRLFYFMVLL